MLVTVDILKAIAPGGKKTNYKLFPELCNWMNYYFPLYQIDQRGEYCHFIAQAAHETDSFNTLEEYATGDAYDTRTDLGNTPAKDGDGRLYKGKGIFQTTGKANYQILTIRYREQFKEKIDFVTHPNYLKLPNWAVWSACEYWDGKNFNTIANMPDTARVPYKRKGSTIYVSPVEYISRKINGGTYGLAERKTFYERAKEIIK